jgi:hypothetical protein
MLKGVIEALKKQYIRPTVGIVAEQLGIFFTSQFRILYKDLFYEENGLVEYGKKHTPKPSIRRLKKHKSKGRN